MDDRRGRPPVPQSGCGIGSRCGYCIRCKAFRLRYLLRGILLRETLYTLVFLLSVAVFAKIRSRSVRQPVLLIGSYLLYLSWGIWFAGVLLASTVMNFLLGEWLRRTPTRLALATGILL